MPGLQAGKKTENFQAQFGRWFCTRNTGIFLKTEMCWWCCVSKIFAQRINVPTVFARKCSFRNWHFSILSGYHPCELGAAVCDALVERQKINGAEATLRWGQPLVNLRRKTTSFRKILFEWLIDWWMDWWIDGLMDWWTDGLMDWWIDGLMDWWTDWWMDCLIDWLFWLVHVVSLFPVSIHTGSWMVIKCPMPAEQILVYITVLCVWVNSGLVCLGAHAKNIAMFRIHALMVAMLPFKT